MAVAALSGDVSADRGSLNGRRHDRRGKRNGPLSHGVLQDGCGSQRSDQQALAAASQIAFSSNPPLAGSTFQQMGYETVCPHRSAPGLGKARVHSATEPGRYAGGIYRRITAFAWRRRRITKLLMEQRRPIGRDAVIDSWHDISVLMVVIGHQLAGRPREVYPVIAPNPWVCRTAT